MATPTSTITRRIRNLTLALGLCTAACAFAPSVHAQGCVAIKQMGDTMGASCDLESIASEAKWNFSVSYLHFRSHRHYVGTVEQTQRYTAGSEVMNIVDQIDTALAYQATPRVSVTLGVPYFHATRTSLYEHDRVNRYKMRASGIGDVRLTSEYWLFDPRTHAKGNVQVGLGLKFPTGDTNAKDYAHTTSGLVYRSVDQSIQPGDGGWGYIVELQGFQQLAEKTSLYATGFYLLNPQETNGTRVGNNPNSVTGYMSIADQYQARLGVSQHITHKYGFTASLGGRLEGVPALDVIGGNRGFRRPGYVLSVEPGISFSTAHDSLAISVPVALVRNRTRSYADRLSGGHGDAAFADFLISVTYARRW